MNPCLTLSATLNYYNSDANAIYNETKFDTVSSSTELDERINLENLHTIDHYLEGKRGKILEIGCANGYFLSKAKELGYQVYGSELNEKNYKIARSRIGDTIFNRDLFDLHFEDESFDVVYMRDVIEHIVNPGCFLTELHRISRPGSLLFIEIHNIDGLIYRMVREKHTVIFGFEHPNHWSPRSMGTALERSGFFICRVMFASRDFSIGDIIGYFIEPTFTTVYPWSSSKPRKMLLKAFQLPFLFPPIRWLDHLILGGFADISRKGSVMKIIAQRGERIKSEKTN